MARKDFVYLIERRKPDRNGRRERVQYTGPLRLRPKGWRVVRCLGYAMDGDGSGLAYS